MLDGSAAGEMFDDSGESLFDPPEVRLTVLVEKFIGLIKISRILTALPWILRYKNY